VPPEIAFTVETLSRGKGVPPEAKEALEQLRAYVEDERAKGVPVSLTMTRIGIEGETRTCIAFQTQEARKKAFDHAKSLFEGQELVNLRLERCDDEGASKK
jgi:hypothetical protein